MNQCLHGQVRQCPESVGLGKNLLRTTRLRNDEVYGQFPPEGSVASHVMCSISYRWSRLPIATPYKELSLMGLRARKGNVLGVTVWGRLGELFTECTQEKYPKMTKGPHAESLIQPHKSIAQHWRTGMKVKRHWPGASWVTDLGGEQFARLPSLVGAGAIKCRLLEKALVVPLIEMPVAVKRWYVDGRYATAAFSRLRFHTPI